MQTEEMKMMIDKYFDGELDKQKEAFLFLELSRDESAREYFKQMNSLKTMVENSAEEFPPYLEEKILRSIGKQNVNHNAGFFDKKIFDAVVYTAVVLFAALTFFFYFKSEEYKSQFFDLTREVKKQSEKLELIMNALPRIEVEEEYVKTKQIIVTPNS